MDGILCIDKPPGHTSFDVVARMRGIAKMKKIGHGGTLDPMATGVLPVFLGRAAKACDMMPVQDKRYTATFQLGRTTDTQDSTGTVLTEHPVHADRAAVEQALRPFLGPQEQIPPMFSSVRVGGKHLYELARQGIEIERKPRPVTIHSIALLEAEEESHTYTIDVACSKGTYIRTLCHDLGQRLGCGAVMTALRRTEACGFALADCLTLEQAAELAGEGRLAEPLLPVSAVFASLPKLVLDNRLAKLFQNGLALSLRQFETPPTETVAVYRQDGVFFGVARPQEGSLKLVRLFYLGD